MQQGPHRDSWEAWAGAGGKPHGAKDIALREEDSADAGARSRPPPQHQCDLWAWRSWGCRPSCRSRESDGRDTRRTPQGEPGHGGWAAFFPGSLLRTRHCWGPRVGRRDPGPSADEGCTNTPSSEPGLLTARAFPSAPSAPPCSLGGRGLAGQPRVHRPPCLASSGGAQGTGEQRGSVTLASEPVQGRGEALLVGSQGKIAPVPSAGRLADLLYQLLV